MFWVHKRTKCIHIEKYAKCNASFARMSKNWVLNVGRCTISMKWGCSASGIMVTAAILHAPAVAHFNEAVMLWCAFMCEKRLHVRLQLLKKEVEEELVKKLVGTMPPMSKFAHHTISIPHWSVLPTSTPYCLLWLVCICNHSTVGATLGRAIQFNFTLIPKDR